MAADTPVVVAVAEAVALVVEPILVARRRLNVVNRLKRELRAEELETTAARKSA